MSEEWKKKILALFETTETKKKEDPTWFPVPPNPYVSKVNQLGQLWVKFYSDILLVPDL